MLSPDAALLTNTIVPVRAISSCAIASAMGGFNIIEIQFKIRPHVDRLDVVRLPRFIG